MFNTSRPFEIPESLLSKQKYDGDDVYETLRKIFFDKCYICETKEPHDINIEHFYSHQGDVSKKFDWTNLYLACSRCNNIKSAAYNDILDCCDSTIDVFRAIKHLPPATPYAKTVQIVSMLNDKKTESSRELLEKIYNSNHTVNKRVSSSFLRRKIFDQYNLLLDQVNDYYAPTATETEKNLSIEKIQTLINKSAPYSAFIRWCILEDEELSPKLESLMD